MSYWLIGFGILIAVSVAVAFGIFVVWMEPRLSRPSGRIRTGIDVVQNFDPVAMTSMLCLVKKVQRGIVAGMVTAFVLLFLDAIVLFTGWLFIAAVAVALCALVGLTTTGVLEGLLKGRIRDAS